MTPLSSEIYMLVLTTVFTSLLWVPHILQRIIEMKPYAAFRDPGHDVPTQAGWARRNIRAHTNAVENLVIFATLVIVLEITGANTALTATAATLYFASRVAHVIVYTLAFPWLRTPIYLLGFGCQMIIATAILIKT